MYFFTFHVKKWMENVVQNLLKIHNLYPSLLGRFIYRIFTVLGSLYDSFELVTQIAHLLGLLLVNEFVLHSAGNHLRDLVPFSTSDGAVGPGQYLGVLVGPGTQGH